MIFWERPRIRAIGPTILPRATDHSVARVIRAVNVTRSYHFLSDKNRLDDYTMMIENN